jgi:prepilin-type processing-associated H-X9-DG protein
MVCPSDGRSKDDNKGFYGFTHYLGVEGLDYSTRDGMLFMGSRVKFADVRDGTSNTIMVGERPPSANGAFGWWYAGWGQNKTGALDMVLGVRERNSYTDPNTALCFRGPYRFQPGQTPCDFFHFWSYHPGGANFLFVDGSARHLSYAGDRIIEAMASRSGGEVVDE